MNRRALMVAVALAAAGGCADQPPQRDGTYDRISATMDQAVKERAKAAAPDAVSRALLPPLDVGASVIEPELTRRSLRPVRVACR